MGCGLGTHVPKPFPGGEMVAWLEVPNKWLKSILKLTGMI